MRSALKMLRAKPAPVGLGSWLQMMDIMSGQGLSSSGCVCGVGVWRRYILGTDCVVKTGDTEVDGDG